MGKKSSPPPAPDYASLAREQAALGKQAIQDQTTANRPNQIGPGGTLTWKQDPTTGQWTQTTSLTPDAQAAFDAQQGVKRGLAETGQGLLGNAQGAVSSPLDLSGLPPVQQFQSQQIPGQGLNEWGKLDYSGAPQLSDAGFAPVEQIQQAMMARLRPGLDSQRQAEIQRLKAQGITEGTPAWNEAMFNLNRSANDAEQNALLGAAGEGRQLFQQSLAARQQGVSEADRMAQFANSLRGQQLGEQQLQFQDTNAQQEQARRSQEQDYARMLSQALLQRQQPLNELNSFMSGSQLQMPQFGSFSQSGAAAPPNIYGAAQDQYGAQMNQFNADQARRSNTTSGLFSLAGTLGGAMLGGPMGASIGGSLGKGLGGLFSPQPYSMSDQTGNGWY
jgi:hypothetical protein